MASIDDTNPDAPQEQSDGITELFLTPGSSRHPYLVLALDIAFAALLCVFIGLLFLTGGNIHIIVLIVIELGLWGSVKWVLYELSNTALQEDPNSQDTAETKKEQ